VAGGAAEHGQSVSPEPAGQRLPDESAGVSAVCESDSKMQSLTPSDPPPSDPPLVVGANAVTFNAAGLNSATLTPYNVSMSNAGSLIQAYYIRGEILSTVQDHTFFPSAAGTRIPLTPATSGGALAQHSINNVIAALGGN
jgi:hypothetical protein